LSSRGRRTPFYHHGGATRSSSYATISLAQQADCRPATSWTPPHKLTNRRRTEQLRRREHAIKYSERLARNVQIQHEPPGYFFECLVHRGPACAKQKHAVILIFMAAATIRFTPQSVQHKKPAPQLASSSRKPLRVPVRMLPNTAGPIMPVKPHARGFLLGLQRLSPPMQRGSRGKRPEASKLARVVLQTAATPGRISRTGVTRFLSDKIRSARNLIMNCSGGRLSLCRRRLAPARRENNPMIECSAFSSRANTASSARACTRLAVWHWHFPSCIIAFLIY